jgi:hypothetical protein
MLGTIGIYVAYLLSLQRHLSINALMSKTCIRDIPGHEGRWILEVRRVLDTKSQYDVPFIPGKPVFITVVPFNRTQTRHSEHIEPVRVLLQK